VVWWKFRFFLFDTISFNDIFTSERLALKYKIPMQRKIMGYGVALFCTAALGGAISTFAAEAPVAADTKAPVDPKAAADPKAAPADAAAAKKAVEPEKKSPWERSITVGATVTRGNSKTLLFNANVLALRKWNQNEISLGADGSYGESDDVKNMEQLHGFGQYNRLFTDRFFAYGRVDALHDGVADVDYRLTIGPGVGYYFIKNEKTRLSAEAGPSLVVERQGKVDNQYMAARIAERFEQKLNDRARVWQSLEFLPQVDKLDNYIMNAEAGIEADFTKKLSLRTLIQDTYHNQPAAGRKANDIKLISGISYKF
jgi:putative salt-induced outer membrane protein YdiY